MFGRAVTSGHERKDSGEQEGRSKLVELGCRQKLALMVKRETALSGKKAASVLRGGDRWP